MSGESQPHLASLHHLSDSYSAVFDAIDTLRDAGLRRELIPKLVVVGDQKSGKSSVLEAICRIPFPVDEDLCTRFPIEVVQRRSGQESVSVTIVAEDTDDNRDNLAHFSKTLSPADSGGLISTIKEASSLILGSPKPGGSQHFSSHVLRITIWGPERYPLTLVDLPGLFHSSGDGQDQQDKLKVDDMVRSYLREPRNALLLVTSASSPWVNQRVPEEVSAPDADFQGSRTLGIITRVDRRHGDLDLFRRFENDGPWNPQHGWHCLKNRSQEERIRLEDRDAVEAAYFEDNLTEIDETCKGIGHLLPKLSRFLASQIRRHLRDLIKEVRGQIKFLNGKVDLLGKKRTSEQEQRDYLSRMAGEFQLLCCYAINGHYGEGTVPIPLRMFFNDPKDSRQRSQDKRLQAVVRSMGKLFNSTMMQRGKRTRILNPVQDTEGGETRVYYSSTGSRVSKSRRSSRSSVDSEDNSETDRSEHGDGKKDNIKEQDNEEEYDEEEYDEEEYDENHEEQDYSKKPLRNCTDGADTAPPADQRSPHATCKTLRSETIESYILFPLPTQMSFESFEAQALDMATQWRGTESSREANPAMISQLFRQETSRWRAIARHHLELVCEAVTRFVRLALKHCVEASILPYINRYIVDSRLEWLRQHAEQKLEELLLCHEGMNPAFHDALDELGGETPEDAFRLERTSEPATRQTGQQLLGQLKSALSSQPVETMLKTAFSAVGGGISAKGHFAKLLLEEVKGIVEGATDPGIPAPPAQHHPQQVAMSLVAFITYVNALVVQNGLLVKLPYEIFTHSIISEQKADTISKIAGEKESDVKERSECEKKLMILRNALVCFEDFQNDIS
ncbi:hypothetical protein FDECE_11746 [Fusarium decemcellulare]|nr:hypothetical protein FDECE_11746 [Fusarium decemcellulare]